jgi:hypothetical protein
MITAHVEQLRDVLEELKPLFEPHYAELALNQDKVPLAPQYEEYLAREAAGQVLCVTLRERGRVVGYFVGFIAPALHYRTCLTLTMDIFWLMPELRGEDSLGVVDEEMAAGVLFETVQFEARRRGVKRALFGSKAHRDCGAMFIAMGMIETDVYYSAWWGE